MKLVAMALAMALAGSSYNRGDWISANQWKHTREHILDRDQVNGQWVCKYSGVSIPNSRNVDIDHIIPLKYAYDNGGANFSPDRKHQMATDDSNLVSVSAHENRSKGDKGLSEYLPSQNQCWYLRHWDYVARKYGVKIRGQDASILAKGLASCPTK